MSILERGHTLGLFHLLIGRRIEKDQGTLISAGVSWRELATLLKKTRWLKDTVTELGIQPAALPPRDRQLYWYVAISAAKVDSPEARSAGQARSSP